MAVMQSYNYTIEATYFSNGKESTIMTEAIQGIIIKYDYITKTMPIIYLTIKLQIDLFNIMVKNADNGIITLTIQKFIKTTEGISKKSPYLRREFSYFIQSDMDYDKTMESGNTNSNSYKVCTLGLYDMDIINRNSINFNDINTVIKNSDMQSIVHYCTSSLKMIVEPFKDNEKIPYCILPPIDTVTKLLDYLNSVHNFYNTSYLFFKDFEKNYLLSLNGNPIGIKTGDYSTIIIRIMDKVEYQTKLQSIEVDNKKKAYILYIDASFITTKIDRLKEKKYHKIIGIDSDGEKVETELNIVKNTNGIEKIKLERVYNGNLDYINTIKGEIEKDAFLININKTEIDTDILTPNKEYIVQNFSSYKEYDGNFLLAYKRDIMIQQDKTFISNTIIGLKKV